MASPRQVSAILIGYASPDLTSTIQLLYEIFSGRPRLRLLTFLSGPKMGFSSSRVDTLPDKREIWQEADRTELWNLGHKFAPHGRLAQFYETLSVCKFLSFFNWSLTGDK